jgi:diguanylate cyclase (GGDEF)-like protein
VPTCVAVAVLVGAIGAYTPRAVVEAATDDAIMVAVQKAKQLTILRSFYSDHVVTKATKAGATASPDYATDGKSIPVPTTFLLDVAQAFSADGFELRLVSPYPWPMRGTRQLDAFQTEAWDYLSKYPGDKMVRRETINGREVLRVAVGDHMNASCVNCHNSQALSPKRDWKVGDVRGLIEVVQPMDTVLLSARGLSWKLIVGTTIGGLILLGALIAIGMRLIRPLRELTGVIHRIAHGDVEGDIPHSARQDELGTVARALIDLQSQTNERARAEAQIAHMAHHDALTGLPNRVNFREEMVNALARAKRSRSSIAILCLDLDRFKGVNDTLGHPVGDTLLKVVAERLRDCVRETDAIARLGGDEFAIVQTVSDQPVSSTALAQRLIESLSQPYEVDGHWVMIGASVGISIAPNDGDDPDQLLKNADMALYRAKTDGRGTYRFFEPEMDARMQARRELEMDLRKAIAQDELEVYYQPLVNLEKNKVSGFEALVRWNHPTRGRISPGEFIPLAEEIGVINALGEWVLNQACFDATKWPKHIKVAVNLSPAQFRGGGLVFEVVNALAASGLSPHRLELEVTETIMLMDTEATLTILHQLRELGVRISMDDFGTGYSSLSYLRKFPFDKIKIDQSFIRDLSDAEDTVAIVRAVTGLGESFGMTTTAEGVETEEQLKRLRAEGCTEVQGYLFSPPVPVKKLAGLMRKLGRDLKAA